MSGPSRTGYLILAIIAHVAVLWGIRFGPPEFISSDEEPGDSIEVGLVESAEPSGEPVAAPPAPEPPPPEPPVPTPPPPEPPPPEPPPMQEPPPPKPDAIPEPTPAPVPSATPPPAPPRPRATPAPRRETKPATRPNASPSATATSGGSPTGTRGPSTGSPGSGSGGKPGRGDSAHATWKNRVRPAYPSAARAAGQAGRVLVIVNVNALGRAVSARIYKTSGHPSLDQAALSAARASTYNPKRIAGIPLPDTITIPYTFRLEDR